MIRGTQPDGTMTVSFRNGTIPGHEDCNEIIEIAYYFPNGTQVRRACASPGWEDGWY